jgi:hypothetical protein
MTPQERQLVSDLFDRLEKLEGAPRDRDAERAIAEGLSRAPNAVYALVQTALVQDEALRRADARIRDLSGEGERQDSEGFLDSMRRAFTGNVARGSVPSVRPSGPDPRWNTGGTYAPQANAAPQQAQGGGSFLGTAAASAAGVIGGALLFNTISSLFSGGHHGSAFAGEAARQNSPWDSGASNSDLARDAGLNDIGGGRQGLFDDQSGSGLADLGDDFDSGGDFGGDFGGGDTA